jgi:non-reducing end alpha-L-arabinofuranosidase
MNIAHLTARATRNARLPAALLLAATTTFAAGPCDIYKTGATPCVAAHSTVRALYDTFSGNLYQVRRSSDNSMKDIPVLSRGGAANSAVQDAFCTSTCVITKLYDQSGHGNFMEYQGEGSSVTGSAAPAVATTEKFKLAGNNVYSLYIKPGNTYWRDGHLTGIPTGTQPEGMYMVTSGKHYNSGCCFDYGNSETTRKADAAGAMDAIYFGSSCWFSTTSSYKCNTGSGPWVEADLEWGLFASNSSTTWNPKTVSMTSTYVTAMLKNNGTNRMALKGGNAQSGGLSTFWDGALPYSKMVKQGAIVLGSGGDCCRVGGGVNQSEGTFYEGAMVSGYPTDAVDSAVQANIAAAGYGSATSEVSFERRLPAGDRIFRTMQDRIRLEAEKNEVSVFSLGGKLLARHTFGKGEISLGADLGIPEGIHVVRVRNTDHS